MIKNITSLLIVLASLSCNGQTKKFMKNLENDAIVAEMKTSHGTMLINLEYESDGNQIN